jgi:O-antigen/teichoic acid export membrane protein
MTALAPQPATILAKTARGVGWIVGWRMATRLLGLVSTITLVHLLVPADFGLVALGSSFALAVDALSIIGIEDALIREKSPDRELYDTGFTLNVLRGLASAAIIAATAVPAAHFFAEPRLANVLFALAAATAGSGFVNIGTVEFRRDLAFNKEFQLLVVPRIGGIVVAIAVALTWRSYWALIGGILSSRLLGVALSYAIHPYRPRLTTRGWRSLAEFSFWTWMLSLALLLRERSDNFVIGRVLGSTAVGIYAIGTEIAALPVTELVEPLARATFSGFAAARHSGVDAAETYRRIIAAMALFTLPAGFGISLVADPIVKLAFGAQWLAATPLIQILGISGTVTVLGYVSSTLFSAHALLRPMFRIVLVVALIRVLLLIWLVQRFGLVGAAAGVAVSVVLENTTYVVGTFRRFGLRPTDLLRSIWRCLLATAAMAAVLYLSGLGWHAAAGSGAELAWTLIAAVATGAATYALVLAVLWLAAGRPAGAESDLAGMLGEHLGRLGARRLAGKPEIAARRAGSRAG